MFQCFTISNPRAEVILTKTSNSNLGAIVLSFIFLYPVLQVVLFLHCIDFPENIWLTIEARQSLDEARASLTWCGVSCRDVMWWWLGSFFFFFFLFRNSLFGMREGLDESSRISVCWGGLCVPAVQPPHQWTDTECVNSSLHLSGLSVHQYGSDC